jgi:hypothetical protein
MRFPQIPDLTTRRAFDVGLRDALDGIGVLLQADPTDPTCIALANQLQAIAQWTAGGQDLTQQQKDRVTLGLVAQRELKGDAPELAALLIGLHNHILQRMPTADAGP